MVAIRAMRRRLGEVVKRQMAIGTNAFSAEIGFGQDVPPFRGQGAAAPGCGCKGRPAAAEKSAGPLPRSTPPVKSKFPCDFRDSRGGRVPLLSHIDRRRDLG